MKRVNDLCFVSQAKFYGKLRNENTLKRRKSNVSMKYLIQWITGKTTLYRKWTKNSTLSQSWVILGLCLCSGSYWQNLLQSDALRTNRWWEMLCRAGLTTTKGQCACRLGMFIRTQNSNFLETQVFRPQNSFTLRQKFYLFLTEIKCQD